MKSYTGSKNGKKRRVEVRQVENGYIISVIDTIDDPYSYSCKEYISEKNPFEFTPVWEKMEDDD